MPLANQVHVNAPLTNLSTAWIQDQSNFVADVVPEVRVQKKTDVFFQYDQGDLQRLEAKERAGGAKPNYMDYDITTGQYTCKRANVAIKIDDETAENYDTPLAQDEDQVAVLGQQILMERDSRFATNFFGPTIWDIDDDGVASGPGANQFLQFDATGATPVTTIRGYMDAIHLATGFYPNGCVMGLDVFTTLAEADQVLDKIKHTQKGVVTEDLMASLFGWSNFKVARGVVNSATEGAANSVGSIFDSKAMLLFYAPAAPSLRTPSAFYNFIWSGFSGAGAAGARMKRWRDEECESDVYEMEASYDMKVVSTALGAFLDAAVS